MRVQHTHTPGCHVCRGLLRFASIPVSLVFPCWKQPCSSPAVAEALLGECLQQPWPEQIHNLSLLRCLTHSCSQNEDQGLRRRNEREWTVSFGLVWFFLLSICVWGAVCHWTEGLGSSQALPASCILSQMRIPALRKGWLNQPLSLVSSPPVPNRFLGCSPCSKQGKSSLIHLGRSRLVLPREGNFIVSKRTVILQIQIWKSSQSL